MTTRPRSRQALFDRIRSATRDDAVIEEMVRHGFWRQQTDRDDPAADMARIAELESVLAQLAQEGSQRRNLDRLRKDMRRRRMEEARQRRVVTREKRQEARRERARRWEQRKQREILYLGEGVSPALGKRDGDVPTGLPQVTDGRTLAAAMGVELGELRFLCFHRKVSATSHYVRFDIPKKTGGTRRISAPMPRLKRAQHWVLRQILDRMEIHDAAHGFVKGRSIVTNAAIHVGQKVVVNLDLKDFFPTLELPPRVQGQVPGPRLQPRAGELRCSPCSAPSRTWTRSRSTVAALVYAARGRAPPAPGGAHEPGVITNLVCTPPRRDASTGLAAVSSASRYTRYADDHDLLGLGRGGGQDRRAPQIRCTRSSPGKDFTSPSRQDAHHAPRQLPGGHRPRGERPLGRATATSSPLARHAISGATRRASRQAVWHERRRDGFAHGVRGIREHGRSREGSPHVRRVARRSCTRSDRRGIAPIAGGRVSSGGTARRSTRCAASSARRAAARLSPHP